MHLLGLISDSMYCTVLVSHLLLVNPSPLTLIVQCLSADSDDPCGIHVSDMLDQLRMEYGTRLPTLLLSLELACNRSAFSSDAVSTQLDSIMHTAHLLEANHKLVMHYIQKLGSASTLHATRCLKSYITQRLIPEAKTEWTDQAIITYITMYSAQDTAHSTPTVQSLEQELSVFSDTMRCGIGPVAAQAAHVLV